MAYDDNILLCSTLLHCELDISPVIPGDSRRLDFMNSIRSYNMEPLLIELFVTDHIYFAAGCVYTQVVGLYIHNNKCVRSNKMRIINDTNQNGGDSSTADCHFRRTKTKLKMNKIIKWDDILKRNNGLILNDNESRSTEI